MHAYLVVGESAGVAEKVADLKKTLGNKSYEFSVTKIDEVRKLIQFVKLTFAEPTSIVLNNLEEATDDALNAFLKNLEEPQKNLSYILTSTSEYKLIPTIISRCQVIKVAGNEKVSENRDFIGFLDKPVDQKFVYIDTLRKRDEALTFIKNLIQTWHDTLIKDKGNPEKIARALNLAQKTYQNLHANGNINLQLSNLVVGLEQI